MKLSRYKLNPSVIFREDSSGSGHMFAITEYDKNPYAIEMYKIAMASLKPGETGEFQIVFVGKGL